MSHPGMNELHSKLQALVGDHVVSVRVDAQVWTIEFDNRSALVIECLWRLETTGNIIRTSEDHLQMFGNSTFVDAASELENQTKGVSVSSVTFIPGTADLRLQFGPAIVLEIISTSAEYESWHVSTSTGKELHAISGQLRG